MHGLYLECQHFFKVFKELTYLGDRRRRRDASIESSQESFLSGSQNNHDVDW